MITELFEGTLTSAWPVLADLDVVGYLQSQEVLSLVASLLATFFSGLANAFIGGFFAA